MTEQYPQKNINLPGAPRLIVVPVGLLVFTLTTDDSLVTVDATIAATSVRLPLASEYPGLTLAVQKIDATGNAVTLLLTGADSILGAAGAASLGSQFATTTFKSDGVSSWSVTSNIP